MHSSEELNFMADSVDEALKLLGSNNIAERFRAARFFVSNKHPEYKPTLVERRKQERVRYVKMALSQAISGIDIVENIGVHDSPDRDTSTDRELKLYLKAQAIHEFSGTIIHELSKKIGLLEANLKEEFLAFNGSRSENSFSNLKAVFRGIENLQRSADTPKSSEFDLSQMILDVAYSEEGSSDVVFNFEGSQPCVIKCDQSILHLALSNGIRNSIEAVKQVSNYTSLNNIVVCWGKNDHDIWISIIDNGVGIHGDPQEAFKIGSTNKDGHIGFGLGILSQCMETLGGYAELTGIESGGAKLILRWNKE